ncbi:MAG: endonuclease/exonuclease/phosphatase family protein [Bacteroidota bacterium]
MHKYHLLTLILTLTTPPTTPAKIPTKKSPYTLKAKKGKNPTFKPIGYIALSITTSLTALYLASTPKNKENTPTHTPKTHLIHTTKPALLCSANVFYMNQWKEATPENTMKALNNLIAKRPNYSKIIFAIQEAWGHQGNQLRKMLKAQNFWVSQIHTGCFFAVFPHQGITEKKPIYYQVKKKIKHNYPQDRMFVGIHIEDIGTFANVHLTGGSYEDQYYQHDEVQTLPEKQIIKILQTYNPIVIIGDFNADKHYTDEDLATIPYWQDKAQDHPARKKLKNYLMNRHSILAQKGYKTLDTIKKTSRYGGKPDFIYYKTNAVILKNEKKINTIKSRTSDHDFIYAALYKNPKS